MKVFIITIEGMDSSERLAAKGFESAKSLGYQPFYFMAYTKNDSIELLEEHGIKPISNTSYPYFDLYNKWTSVPGTRGCFASHYALWNVCCQFNEPIIIMEHDAVMLREWSNPDWTDVLHLDWEGSIRRRKMRNGFDSYNNVQENSVFRMGFSPGETSGIISMNCCYAYAIKPHAAAKLIDDVKNIGWFAADRFIREPIVNIETVHPKIAEEQPEAVEMFTTAF